VCGTPNEQDTQLEAGIFVEGGQVVNSATFMIVVVRVGGLSVVGKRSEHFCLDTIAGAS
jgi:hypothetical protein